MSYRLQIKLTIFDMTCLKISLQLRILHKFITLRTASLNISELVRSRVQWSRDLNFYSYFFRHDGAKWWYPVLCWYFTVFVVLENCWCRWYSSTILLELYVARMRMLRWVCSSLQEAEFLMRTCWLGWWQRHESYLQILSLTWQNLDLLVIFASRTVKKFVQ